MKSLSLVLLLLPSLAFSQAEEKLELRKLGECGLTTRYASSQIGDTCLQEAENVVLDEDAGISRRRGFSRFNATAITNTRSVRGIWPFRATDGTEYIVALSSETMFEDDGAGSFTPISPALAGMSSTQDMDCAQCLGRLWCVNGTQTMFFWTGSATGTVAGAPTCSNIDCFRNRLALSDCSGTLSQLRMSGELDGTDYTIPSAPVSTSPVALSIGGVNDGKRVRCIMGVYQDVLVIGKEDSTWGLYGFDRRDFAVREVSREVGCIDNRSAREKQGSLHWLSKRGVEKMTGPSITKVSDPIRDLMDTIIVAGGNSRSAQDTTQGDFEAGNLTASGPGAPINATISPANLVVSTSLVINEGTAINNNSWVMTDVDTTAVSSVFLDNFGDGDFSASPVWTQSNGTWEVSGGGIRQLANGSASESAIDVSQTLSTGVWSYTFRSTTTTIEHYFVYVATTTSIGRSDQFPQDSLSFSVFDNGTTCTIGLIKGNSSDGLGVSASTILSERCTGVSDSTHTVIITRSTGAFISAFFDGTIRVSTRHYLSVGAAATVAGIVHRNAGANYGRANYDNVFFPGFYENQVSTAYNTNFSTPTYGAYSVTLTSATGSSVTFRTETSVNGSSAWSGLTSVNNADRPSSVQRQYIRHQILMAPLTSSSTIASMSALTLSAATTGYFISQCRNPGTAITQWGLFQCNRVLNNGDMTFAISTGISCNAATRSTATWNTQTNNSVIAIATAAFVAYRVLFDIDSGTETPTLNDCTINWNEGTTRPSVSAEVYRDRYYMAYTSGTTGTVANDRILVLDSRDQWVTHDQPNCSVLGSYNRRLYCGDSANTGRVFQMDVGQDDDGSSFTSNIRTKDFDFGNTWQKKELKRMYFDLAGLPDPGYAISLTPSYALDASTDIFTLTSINLNEDYSRFIAAKVPALLSNNVTGRWFNFNLSHTGLQGPWRVFGIKIIFSRLTED